VFINLPCHQVEKSGQSIFEVHLHLIGATQNLTIESANAMISARTLTPHDFLQEFPPCGSGHGAELHSSLAKDPHDPNGCPTSPTSSIINDVPKCARSFLIYNHDVLKRHRGDGTFPAPQRDEFQGLRQLKSLEAVVKEISDGKSVFSHMVVSPPDVRKLFGNEFMKRMQYIQNLVRPNLPLCLIDRSSGKGSLRSRLKSIPV